MRVLFRWLFALTLLIAGFTLARGTSADSAGVSGEEPPCDATVQGRSFNAGSLSCAGAGSDCPGVAD